MMKRHRRWIAGRPARSALKCTLGFAAAALMAASFANAADRNARPAKAIALDNVALESPVQVDSVPAFLANHVQQRAQDSVQTYIARLKTPAVAAGGSVGQIGAEQQAFIARVLAASPASHVVATVRVVANAVFIETDRRRTRCNRSGRFCRARARQWVTIRSR